MLGESWWSKWAASCLDTNNSQETELWQAAPILNKASVKRVGRSLSAPKPASEQSSRSKEGGMQSGFNVITNITPASSIHTSEATSSGSGFPYLSSHPSFPLTLLLHCAGTMTSIQCYKWGIIGPQYFYHLLLSKKYFFLIALCGASHIEGMGFLFLPTVPGMGWVSWVGFSRSVPLRWWYMSQHLIKEAAPEPLLLCSWVAAWLARPTVSQKPQSQTRFGPFVSRSWAFCLGVITSLHHFNRHRTFIVRKSPGHHIMDTSPSFYEWWTFR